MNKGKRREYHKKYYLKNKDKYRENAKLYRLNNPNKISKSDKKYRLENRDEIKKRTKQWRLKNQEKIREKKKQYYLKHKDKLTIQKKEYYQKNKENINKRKKEYRQKNKEKIAMSYKVYQSNNRNKINQRQRKNRQRPEIKIRHNLANRIHQVIKKTKKSKSTIQLVGCSLEYLKDYLECQFDDEMSWGNFMNGEIHIDHIKPCISFDLSEPKEQQKCFHYSNLQPLWARDNIVKGGKD